MTKKEEEKETEKTKDKNVCPVCGNNLVKGGDGVPYCERCVMEYGEWGEKLEEKIKMEKEEKEGLFVFACVVIVWIGIRVTGVF